MDLLTAGILELISGIIFLQVILIIAFNNMHDRHNVVVNKFNEISDKVYANNPNFRQFENDIKILMAHIRILGKESTKWVLFGLGILIGYAVFVSLGIGANVEIFAAVIAASLGPVGWHALMYSRKVGNLYTKMGECVDGYYR